MLKAVGFILFAIGLALKLPEKVRLYKNNKEITDLLEVVAIIILIPSSIILAFS